MPQTEGLTELANEVRLACQRVSRRVRYDSDGVLPPHQMAVLFSLLRGRRTPGDLAAFERVSAPSMSKTVAALAEQGLVEKTPDPEDGRRCQVLLTERGHDVVQAAMANRDSFMVQRLAGLPEADRETLRKAAHILTEVISQ
ncbi:MarR family winged helix-turn-helix transcriptional regulator [Propionicicella superfundia]|uniref:MarR family winged helix-turn-helix transcriptional regulator n=1 Tax=Propionicicella superfundia TaxID=348582 RepID=UPI00048BF6A4|nr:MarR family winged helix-turn-helix transcriptional regulator [Propionicicella superfundia]